MCARVGLYHWKQASASSAMIETSPRTRNLRCGEDDGGFVDEQRGRWGGVEERGATLLERDLDTGGQFPDLTANLGTFTTENFYKFRIISTKRFVP